MTILYEDNHLLAIDKPAGWLVQGDKTGDETLIDWGKGYLKEKYAKPGAVFLTPAHRIDRPVSGAVLFARTDKALSRLTAMFRDKKVQKTYLALVLAAPPDMKGTLRHFLLKDEKRNVVEARLKPFGDAKESITTYALVGTVGKHALLQVSPITGRSHQIRAQLAAIGCPIVGDLKYGAPEPQRDASIALHSWKIELVHPVKLEEMVVEAERPWWARRGEL
jgi:23S rRNA pseudouridine1911/1915/1917 synthase